MRRLARRARYLAAKIRVSADEKLTLERSRHAYGVTMILPGAWEPSSAVNAAAT